MSFAIDFKIGWANLPKLALVAIAYALLAKEVLGFFSANGIISIVWPPSGLALAALLLGGKKYWPGVFAGALIGNLMAGSPFVVSLPIAVGNTLEAFACLLLLNCRGSFDPAFNKSSDYWQLVISGALGACVSAVIGCITLRLAGVIDWSALPHNLLTWWRGDFLGIILMTPLFMTWRRWPCEWFARTNVVETIVFFTLAFLFGQVVFLDWFHDSVGQVARGYWMFLFVAWGAVRFERHGALLVIGMVTMQALLGAAQHTGFFGNDITNTGLSNFWFYMLVLTSVGVSLALVMAERRLDETQLREKSEALQRSNADLEQFAYSVSHDMRQPLRMVAGHLQLLARALADRLEQDDRDNLNFALDGAKRMDAMIVSLLEYSRVGRLTQPKELLSSREVLDESLNFLAPAIEESGGVVNIDGDWPQVFVSRDELSRLLQNLIGNALHYHQPDELPRIEVHSLVNAGVWQVKIVDHGIGIDPQQIDRLFTFFSRLQSRARFEGTGMGLALCRRIVEHHAGRIWVESEGEGRGSTFVFEIPLTIAFPADDIRA